MTINGGNLNVNNQITIENGGTIIQSNGVLSTQNIEIKGGGSYNQTGGELIVGKKFTNKGSFIASGGTVEFTGSGDGGSDFASGTTQFFNVKINDGVDPMFDAKNGANIKIAGNFTNENPDLDVENATFTFNGSGDQTIYSASTPLPATTTFGSLVIDKPSGKIQLLTDVAVENTFTELNGSLDLNSNTLWVAGSPLPVELSSFSAIILKNGIKLEWRTETEVSNYGFEIERSQTSNVKSQDEWIKIGFEEGYGNSNSPKDYSFFDENILAGKYSYRLKQIDTDGKFEYSKIIEVDLGSPMNYELSQNYPNPFNPSTTIRFSLSESSFINLTIFNSLGEKIKELVNELKETGGYTVEFNAKNYPRGTYIYRLQANDFTQIKKMVLIK